MDGWMDGMRDVGMDGGRSNRQTDRWLVLTLLIKFIWPFKDLRLCSEKPGAVLGVSRFS